MVNEFILGGWLVVVGGGWVASTVNLSQHYLGPLESSSRLCCGKRKNTVFNTHIELFRNRWMNMIKEQCRLH